jgi:hypothetical protein
MKYDFTSNLFGKDESEKKQGCSFFTQLLPFVLSGIHSVMVNKVFNSYFFILS